MSNKINPEQPQTGPEAIEQALTQISIDDIENKAKSDLATGKKTKRSGAVALLNIAKGMRRNNITPKDYMIHAVPVIPPKFRPFAAQGDSLIPGDANVLYKDLFDIKDAYEEERQVFGDKNTGASRLALYDAVRSVYGYGDPVKPKTKAKDVQGFLKKITGKTAKFSFYQSKLLAKTQDNVGRSTITVNPALGIDEIELPEDMAFIMYAPHVQKRLKQLGLNDAEALKQTKERTEYAKHALKQVLADRPIVYSRAPAWHAHSVQAAYVKLHDGKDIKINPYVTTGLNADFDGDTINVHVPASDDAVKEAKEKLMPSKTPFSDRVPGKIMHTPKQEQILGLYTAATAPKTKSYYFDTEEEAVDAIRKRQIPLSADVQIGRQKTAATEENKNKDNHKLIFEKRGPVKHPVTGKFIPTKRTLDKSEEIVEKQAKANTAYKRITLSGVIEAGTTSHLKNKTLSFLMPDDPVINEAEEAFKKGNIKPVMKLFRKYRHKEYQENNYSDALFVVYASSIAITDK